MNLQTKIAGLLRTPTTGEPGVKAERLVTSDGQEAKIGQRAYDKHTGRLAQVGLSQQVQIMSGILPTATVTGNNNRKGLSKKSGDGLQTKITSILPTPTCNDANNNSLPESQALRDSIPGAMIRSGMNTGYRLQPAFVEWMMGYPPGWTELDTYPPRPKKQKQAAAPTASKPSATP